MRLGLLSGLFYSESLDSFFYEFLISFLLHVPPISFLILSPHLYLAKSIYHEAPYYAFFSFPRLHFVLKYDQSLSFPKGK
jgi:hypothetical protein